jgi:hypothetical protein
MLLVACLLVLLCCLFELLLALHIPEDPCEACKVLGKGNTPLKRQATQRSNPYAHAPDVLHTTVQGTIKPQNSNPHACAV